MFRSHAADRAWTATEHMLPVWGWAGQTIDEGTWAQVSLVQLVLATAWIASICSSVAKGFGISLDYRGSICLDTSSAKVVTPYYGAERWKRN